MFLILHDGQFLREAYVAHFAAWFVLATFFKKVATLYSPIRLLVLIISKLILLLYIGIFSYMIQVY